MLVHGNEAGLACDSQSKMRLVNLVWTLAVAKLGNALFANPLGAVRVSTLERILDNIVTDDADKLANILSCLFWPPCHILVSQVNAPVLGIFLHTLC